MTKMKIDINDNISISNPLEFTWESNATFSNIKNLFEDKFIWIQGKQFRIIPPSELYRKRNEKDGYYRAIYIQINFATGEYYIGKANRPTWKQLQRYQGSGLKFEGKYKKHRDQFVRYYIAVCKSAEETENLEASIVNSSLIEDSKCLNLVQGGGGTNKHPSIQELKKKKRKYMKLHPEQYQAMIDTARKIFRSGNTPELQARARRIKQVMSAPKYREGFRNRISKWRKNNPEAFQKSLQKSKTSIQKKEVQEKRKRSLSRWKRNNPEKHQQWEHNRKLACQSAESREKHSQAARAWAQRHPEEYKKNMQKLQAASSKVRSKPVAMKDLKTGEILKEFINARAAAKWLYEEGKTRSKNAAGPIGQTCLGRHQQAYGYDWKFIEKNK